MIRLDDLLTATAGMLMTGQEHNHAAIVFNGYCFDSRRAHPGELFVALKTDRGDGHDFVTEALARGCTGALVEAGRMPRDAQLKPQTPIIAVDDTFKALSGYAAFIVRKHGTPIIAVTGSVGKTSAREAIAAVLSRKHNVFRNPANFNGRLGLPIALGALEPQHNILVLEMATDAPGEIHELCQIAPPQVGIVTNVSETHLATFGTLSAVAAEKGMLIEALPENGLAILNRDDARVWAMRARTQAAVIGVRADTPLKLASVIAREIGHHFAIPEDDIDTALRDLPTLPGRMRPLRGMNGATLIDDTFSAGPASMRAAIDAVIAGRIAESPPEAKNPNSLLSTLSQTFLVLGDMDQLGDEAIHLHRDIGAYIATKTSLVAVNLQSPISNLLLITLGELAGHIAAGALDAGMDTAHVITTYTARDAHDAVTSRANAGDIVLVKGDTSARMERVVAALLADHADVSLLARQEPGWPQSASRVRLAQPTRPTWLEIDLDAIAHNARAIKQHIGPDVTLMAVLKANGYGHGAVKAARTALNNGAGVCGVASLNEAIALRAGNIDEPILILGYTPAWLAREALMRNLSVTLYDVDIARSFSRAATELGRAARVHIKIDSGMGRLGVLPEHAVAFIRMAAQLPGIEIEGVFTHFSCADSDAQYTRHQLARFQDVLREGNIVTHDQPVPPGGLAVTYLHAANSAATLALPEARLNMVRVGLSLYGLSPFSPAGDPDNPAIHLQAQLRPALAWKTTIAQVKTLPAGHPVSYGATYRCPDERRIAVIPVGYADGFRRAPAHATEVLVRGQLAQIVGRVCMDQTMIDVTDIAGVRIGDEVVVIGRQGNEKITVEEMAEHFGTINYEVVSAILSRVPRVS